MPTQASENQANTMCKYFQYLMYNMVPTVSNTILYA